MSITQSSANWVVIDIVGLLGFVLCLVALVGNGLVWFTPENEYAATTVDAGPFIVTIMSPVPVGFLRYQNSASLLEKEPVALVNGMPPNVIVPTLLSFADTPTKSNRSLPVPTLKFDNVIWFDDVVPDVDWTLFSTMPGDCGGGVL